MALRKALKTLPQTLGETYERILCAINEDDSDYAIRILRWLAFCCRPLLIEEIAEVVAIDVERNPAFNNDEVLEDPLEVLSICSSLVTITATGKHSSTKRIVTLAHYSVKEYLTTEKILQSRAARYGIQGIACNEFIAKGCIGYLLQFQGPSPVSKATFQESKLARYAARFWITHTQAAAQNAEDLNCMIMELFSTENGAYLNWSRIYNPDRPWERPNFDRTLAEVPAPLYVASLCGLVEVVDLLLFKARADVNARGGEFGTPLQAASGKGHDKTVELLLDKGADVNAQSGLYNTALQVASIEGHDRIVELLLAKGADINVQSEFYGTALQAASERGHDKTVELLLAGGANINASARFYGTALEGALRNGHNRIVELLFARGANINAQGEFCGTALEEALRGGRKRIAKLLLNRGANINE
jgi:ankyrin repeat protein